MWRNNCGLVTYWHNRSEFRDWFVAKGGPRHWCVPNLYDEGIEFPSASHKNVACRTEFTRFYLTQHSKNYYWASGPQLADILFFWGGRNHCNVLYPTSKHVFEFLKISGPGQMPGCPCHWLRAWLEPNILDTGYVCNIAYMPVAERVEWRTKKPESLTRPTLARHFLQAEQQQTH